jgi:1-acyl-sn-glycerol-3-phosphate acyltransferase
MIHPPRIRRTLAARASAHLQRRELARLRQVQVVDAGHGYDVFGMHPDWVAAGVWLTRFFHRTYFRVTAHGAENLPAAGRAILAANHGGLLPLDAAMLYADVLAHTDPPRVARPVADHFVPALPFIGTFFARVGVVNGTRANVARLLEQEELVMIFPEGTPGIAKPRSERYRLQAWRVGHAELALRHKAPVVPVAIIGAEEQWPVAARLDWLHPFGAPFLPVPATPVPLPVHYHIHYGRPLALHEDGGDPLDPDVVAAAAERVRAAVAALLAEGLRARRGVFA